MTKDASSQQEPANPLFVQWLSEWYETARSDAAVNGAASKLPFTYKKALDNMRQYPEKLPSGTAASRVKYVGPKIAERLQARLSKYLDEHPEERSLWAMNAPTLVSNIESVAGGHGSASNARRSLPDPNAISSTTSRSKSSRRAGSSNPDADAQTNGTDPSTRKKRAASQRVYVPRYRSGAYALIIALHKHAPQPSGFMTKHDLIAAAQPYADASFTVTNHAHGGFATAWTSMNTLVNKELVYRTGHPHRFALTEEGLELAEKLEQVGVPGATRKAPSVSVLPNQVERLSEDEHDISDDDLMEIPSQQISQPQQHAFVYVDERGRDVARKSMASVRICESTLSVQFKIKFVPDSLPARLSVRVHQHQIVSSTVAIGFLEDKYAPEVVDQKNMSINIAKQKHRFAHDVVTNARNSQSSQSVSTKIHGSSAPLSSTNQANSSTVPDIQIPEHQLLHFPAGSYEIVLVLDSREVIQRTQRRFFQDELERLKVTVLTRSLPLGDVIWIARPKQLSNNGANRVHADAPANEIVLDYIVERKLLDDLVASIKDDRYREQKHRLSHCGIRNVVYLVEDGQRNDAQGFGMDRIMSAMAQTMVKDGFFLRCTSSAQDTVKYLYNMTRMLNAMHRGRDLRAVRAADVSKDVLRAMQHRNQHSNDLNKTNLLLTFEAYSGLNGKTDTLALKDIWMRQLMCIRGVSAEKATSIATTYTTPGALFRALCLEQDLSQRIDLIRRAGGSNNGRKAIGPTLAKTILDTLFPT